MITGGPGAGKTTLVNALAERGYGRTIEAGRAIIAAAAKAGAPHPWIDPRHFAARMLEWERASYDAAMSQDEVVFFDRGVPDVAGYLALVGLPLNADVDAAARTLRYNHHVFVAPPWAEIYVQDQHRTQTFDEAARTCLLIAQAYQAYGYELVELPLGALEERVEFIVDFVTA